MRGSTAPGLHMDLLTPELPPIAALFVIQFDLKAGYTITWKRTTPNITLDGVEFKSLPSGLHNLDHDLIYFVHPPHAGISAFIRVPAPSSDRNALQLSIGALVPLSYGRLGRSWRHAANLQSLARSFAADPKAHGVLDEYFHTHSIPSVDSGGENLRYRGGGDRRKGSESGLAKELEPFHPARSLRGFISLLGPLVWPVWRAAVEGKRILVVTGAPVEKACNFVYDISILSTIPLSSHPLLPRPPPRLRPLFSIGVSDIPLLETEAKTHGSWVACTTDEILHMKTALYDLIITLPPSHNAAAWPKLETSAGAPVLATQRDLVRYRGLKRWLGGGSEDDEDSGRREESVCEPLSWREIAYTGFLWWASAGEKRGESDGDEGRRPLLGEEESESESDGDGDGDRDGGEEEGAPQKKEAGGCLEAEVVGYFQGVTDALLAGIAEVVEDAEEGEVVVFGCEEVERLGLDKGETDAAFVKAVCERYFGREARVEVEGWSCLGGLC
ncbi:uncharacterized protein LAJ45_02293 [Morchella importuna]|uniref:uncharacterized protein n=1 Tax=Morchella importuna TaxID=1174673 RepID=UPI001E8CD536|nr:uncharacterized protein LAJ45_02293 [Morchella importuna]KAH8153480.1 hypothetical protein LAJ45_02293 [Morchella importuna]